jgi:hypothetical protein
MGSRTRSKSLLLIGGNLVSVAMVLWFSRAFYFHAGLAGWGDAAADREQYLLWWARLASVVVLFLVIVLSAKHYPRYRWSVLAGATITTALWLLGGFSVTKYLGSLLMMGWFGAALIFGVHADMSGLNAPLCWMLGFNTALYSSIIALIWPRATTASASEKLGASS